MEKATIKRNKKSVLHNGTWKAVIIGDLVIIKVLAVMIYQVMAEGGISHGLYSLQWFKQLSLLGPLRQCLWAAVFISGFRIEKVIGKEVASRREKRSWHILGQVGSASFSVSPVPRDKRRSRCFDCMCTEFRAEAGSSPARIHELERFR